MRRLKAKVMMKTDIRNPFKVRDPVSVWQLTGQNRDETRKTNEERRNLTASFSKLSPKNTKRHSRTIHNNMLVLD